MLKRIGISLEEDLLEKFDVLIEERGYTNRSEAVRDLIRNELVQKEWTDSQHVNMGVAVLVYDHHKMDLGQRLTDVQHDHHDLIVSTMHVHIDHHNCLEMIVLRGKQRDIKKLGESLISVRGVKHGRFIPATTGASLK